MEDDLNFLVNGRQPNNCFGYGRRLQNFVNERWYNLFLKEDDLYKWKMAVVILSIKEVLNFN